MEETIGKQRIAWRPKSGGWDEFWAAGSKFPKVLVQIGAEPQQLDLLLEEPGLLLPVLLLRVLVLVMLICLLVFCCYWLVCLLSLSFWLFCSSPPCPRFVVLLFVSFPPAARRKGDRPQPSAPSPYHIRSSHHIAIVSIMLCDNVIR